MPGDTQQWPPQKRRQHDQHYREIKRRVASTTSHFKALRADAVKILQFSAAIADALGVPKDEGAEPGKDEGAAPGSEQHNLRESLLRVHQSIATATTDNLSPAQARVHHRNLDKLIPVYKRSAERTARLSGDLMEIHRRLLAISKLYKQ